MTSLPLNKIPCRAPFPIPDTFETGTPITSAPGHPRTKIVTANSILRLISQTIIANTKTEGV